MLLYAVRLSLGSRDYDAVIAAAASWLSRKTRISFGASSISKDFHRGMTDGSAISVVQDGTIAPRLYSLRYSHPDSVIRGREWITELGIRADAHTPLTCTIALRVEESGLRVSQPIQLTRPNLVPYVLKACHSDLLASGDVKYLPDALSATAFQEGIADKRRSHPIVLVSPTPNGTYLVNAARCADMLIGVAEVVQIPPDADSFAIGQVMGSQMTAFNGAVNIIRPPVTRSSLSYIPNIRLLAENLLDLEFSGGSADNEVIATVLQFMNHVHFREHISPEHVREEALRRELARRRADLEQQSEKSEYARLLEEDNDKLRARANSLEAEKNDLEDRLLDLQDESDDDIRRLKYDLEGVRLQLQNAYSDKESSAAATLSLDELRPAVAELCSGHLSVEQAVKLFRVLNPEGVIVLESAIRSARDAEGLSGGIEILRLLLKLGSNYRAAMLGGLGDAEARKVFGKDEFAATESETTKRSRRATEARTFAYGDETVVMTRHLKFGVKDDSLRVYFHWDAEAGCVVIGHCGKHLPLG